MASLYVFWCGLAALSGCSSVGKAMSCCLHTEMTSWPGLIAAVGSSQGTGLLTAGGENRVWTWVFGGLKDASRSKVLFMVWVGACVDARAASSSWLCGQRPASASGGAVVCSNSPEGDDSPAPSIVLLHLQQDTLATEMTASLAVGSREMLWCFYWHDGRNNFVGTWCSLVAHD